MTFAEVLHSAADPGEAVGDGSAFDLVQLMNAKLPLETKRIPPSPDQSYRVSHLVKLCAREEALRHVHQIHHTDRVDARLRRTFDIGKAFHTLAQNDWFGKWGWLIGDWECFQCHRKHLDQVIPKRCLQCFSTENFLYHEPEPFNEEHGITAHLDGILLVNGHKRILELKTCNSLMFSLAANINRKPQAAHKRQIQMYMFLTGIHEGVILYFDKNESMIHQFDEVYDEAVVELMLNQLRLARESMKSRTIPKREICDTRSCVRAKTCSVRDLCFK